LRKKALSEYVERMRAELSSDQLKALIDGLEDDQVRDLFNK